MSYPAALHFTARPAAGSPGAAHGGVRPRIARPGRQLPAGDAPAARVRHRWPTTAGATRAPGSGGVVDLGGHIDDLLAIADDGARRGRRPGGGRSGTASAATSWSAPRWPRRGPSTPSAPSSRPCRGWASAAGGGTPVAAAGRRSRRRGRALLRPDGGRGRVGPPDRGGPGRSGGPTGPRWWPTCAACGARAPPSTSPRSTCPRCSAGAARRRPRTTAARVEWLGANVPGAVVYEIANAQHGAHLSHPDHFAAMTRLVDGSGREAAGSG